MREVLQDVGTEQVVIRDMKEKIFGREQMVILSTNPQEKFS